MNNIEETIRALILPYYKNVYIGEAPIDRDPCVWVRASSGGSNIFFDKDTYDYPSYLVYARSVKNQEAKVMIENVHKALANYTGSGFVILVKRLPRYIGRDAKDRALYSITIEYQLGGY